ncbi:MAG: Mechanosensitive ion channel protein MscS [uncultured Campylobacterales bacterium]|uniref:Mechanosensitive ion channel protein MscS n=1 Tax=uncultured Campylobacterales bacterium TaxID=352960 RepID=A0A6S6S3J5_9BACT|nr:MAG: Mechanosensitive ion channel protein MscS [uncultured Campylobacterales bacterium]
MNLMDLLKETLNYSILGITTQNIVLAFVVFSVIMLFRKIFIKTILHYLEKLVKKTKNNFDDKLVAILQKPLRFSFFILALFLVKEIVSIDKLNGLFDNILFSLIIVVISWALFNILNEINYIFSSFSKKFGQDLSSDIENFILKTLRVVVIIFAFMIIAEHWGINISAFIASLGLGGLAFALAAKDTVANLFGSLVIFMDRPFKAGDWIEAGDINGVVEDIGIRSTNIRTFAKSIITVPNAKLTDEPINNWSRMNKRRIKHRLDITYGTKVAQVKNIISDIKTMLENHPDIHKDQIMVYFDEFRASSLSLFCYYFTVTTEWDEYLRVREDTNLKIMDIIESNGASFAFPSQSLYIEKLANKQDV